MSKNREILNSLKPSKGTNWKEKLEYRRQNKEKIHKDINDALDNKYINT